MTDTNERDLVLRLKTYRTQRKELEAKLDELQRAENEAEQALLEHLESINASQTAKFDGIGYAMIPKPRLFASCPEENFGQLKHYLTNLNRLDLVKEKVMPSTLSSFVSEQIAEGKPIPDFINYYLKSTVKIY